MDVLDSVIGHQQTIFNIETYLFLGRLVEGLPNEKTIVRIHALKDLIESRLSRSIEFEDIVSFIRPVNLSSRNVPTETAGLAHSLRLSEERLALLQLLMRSLQIGIKGRALERSSLFLQPRIEFQHNAEAVFKLETKAI